MEELNKIFNMIYTAALPSNFRKAGEREEERQERKIRQAREIREKRKDARARWGVPP